MFLIFTDESGTNKDSKIVLYGGLVIYQDNLFKLEILISQLIKKFFDIENLFDIEFHFYEIFNYIILNRYPSNPKKKEKFEKKILSFIKDKNSNELLEFINEAIHLINKLNIRFIYSFLEKESNQNNNAIVFKICLNAIDRFLNENNDMGILIADNFANQLPKKFNKTSFFENIKNHENNLELLFKRVLLESTEWKNGFLNFEEKLVNLRYEFENNIFNIIDKIFFVSSNESLINQISDMFLFLARKQIERNNLDKKVKSFLDKIEWKELNYWEIKLIKETNDYAIIDKNI